MPVTQKAVIRYDGESQLAIIHVRGHMLQLRGLPPELLRRLFGERSEVVRGEDLLSAYPKMEWDKLKNGLLQMFDHGLILLADEPGADASRSRSDEERDSTPLPEIPSVDNSREIARGDSRQSD
jgi:hypothetical protein